MAKLTLTSGMKLLRSRDYQAVYDLAVEALRQDERNPLAFFLLGVVASDTGNHDKALEFLTKATEHAPENTPGNGPENIYYQTYHAKALVTLGHMSQAKIQADKAASINTSDALLSDMIGVVYSRTGYHELAIPFFEKAVKKNPRWAKFHFNLGASAEFIGDFKTAKTAYANTLSIDPKFYLAWFSLIALEKQTPDNNELEKLKSLFDGASTDVDAQLLIGHSVAKSLEDLGRHEESFKWLEKAKASKRDQVQYNRQNTARVFEAVKTTAVISRSGSSTAINTGANAAPLFVVGLPRTGTTLIDRILSSHPRISSAGELNLFSELINTAVGAPANAGLNPDVFLAANQVDLLSVGKSYTEQTKNLGQGVEHLVDKTPFNFFYAGLIHRALPNAKIIVLRRGALDSCLSNYRQMFAASNTDYDYSFDLEDTAEFYREFDELMAHWRKTLPSSQFMEVAYEDVIFDQEGQIRKLLEFCELNWDEACMNFHENNAPVSTASAVQVRQPLYSSSVGRWKKYGHKLDGLKSSLGYLAD